MKIPIAAALAALCAALGALPGAAFAAEREACEVPGYLLFGNNELKHVSEAVQKDKRLTVAVVGTGSSLRRGSRRRSNGGFLRSTSRSSASPEAG